MALSSSPTPPCRGIQQVPRAGGFWLMALSSSPTPPWRGIQQVPRAGGFWLMALSSSPTPPWRGIQQVPRAGGFWLMATVTLTNSTVSGNTAGSQGGGILAVSDATLTNSTVSGNTAGSQDAGGFWLMALSSSPTPPCRGMRRVPLAGELILSLVALFVIAPSPSILPMRAVGYLALAARSTSVIASLPKIQLATSPDIGSSSIGTGYTNAGNNLIGINTGFEATFPASSLVGTASSPVDPLLAPLADNGGATQTHALLPGSPAINAGNNALIPSGVTTDQRGEGFARIVGGTVDIGAFEVQSISPIPNPPDFSNLIVTNGNDSGVGSLRLAILTANDLAGADTITFSGNFTINLTTGELTVTDPAGLTINGNGATNTIIDGNNTSRVFNVTAGDITFNGVTIRNGNTPDDGAGIFADGNVTLNNSTVMGNTAGSQGGGIFARGNLTLNNSTVSGNRTITSYGGGIRVASGAGIITLNNSTVSGNRAGSDAGGIDSSGAGVILNNSTVSGNTGTRGGGIWSSGFVILNNSTVSGNTGTDGGGIWSSGTTTIRNSTIAFNTGNTGGGIFSAGGTIDIGNSIVAKNTAPTSPDIGGSSYTNAGNNLIGINTGFEATFPASSLVGTASSPVDPLLAPLANNGGATQTHALLPGSPAINAGNNALIPSGVTTDQRGEGFARIVGGTVDIGAFEVQSISPIPNPPDFSNLIVTNGNDSGAGSLRFAILTANDLAGADTITFSSNFIISLTSGN
jgi:predicted outer membrane repeat protein